MSKECGSSRMVAGRNVTWPFRGFCLCVPRQQDFGLFKRLVGEVLPAYGCNALVLLIRYQYEFKSHPEVCDAEALTRGQAAELVSICRGNHIRLIPKMNLLGHQSYKERGSELGLLRSHPEFDETPDLPAVRYCRSLCPRHPRVKDFVCDLMDEILDAFEADALHVGLDEVFEIGLCPRCKGTPNAELFAEWVNALHAHLVGKRKVEMLMWSDRFLDGATTGYGEWEASMNQTWPAIEKVPKDIICCDWHYGTRKDYPSIEIFASKGFRVLVCPWKDLDATDAFIRFAIGRQGGKPIGVLATSWCDSGAVARYLVDAEASVEETPRLVGESFKLAMTL